MCVLMVHACIHSFIHSLKYLLSAYSALNTDVAGNKVMNKKDKILTLMEFFHSSGGRESKQ